MDVVFKAAVRCGQKIGQGDYAHLTCNREAEFEHLVTDETMTAEDFMVLAAHDFEKHGWSIVGKKCRCPAHA